MIKGLTSTQASRFLKQYGLNVISEPPKKNILLKFFEQFNNFLTLLLIGAAILSFFLGESVDGLLIIAIVVLNALFGLYQEAKAEESLKALKEMTVTKVRVIRDGQQIEVDSRYLVPGDVVYLEEGIKVPADGIVAESINMELNEAALTGESLPVFKKEKDEIFSGTIIAKGRGTMLVEKTGDETKFGAIAKNLSLIEEGLTPLQKKLATLTRFIGLGGIVLSLIVFIIASLEGSGYFPAFLLAVSLAVAVVPEGLPAVMTITLAIGMKKMANKKAIVRKLSAIEALGSITLIVTDKTGTLTTNKMAIKEIFIDKKNLLKEDSFLVDKYRHLTDLLVLDGVICSTASLVHNPKYNSWDVLGDPTEGALLYLAQQQGMDIDNERKKWKIVDEKPFDSVSKMMSVITLGTFVENRKEERILFSKGAPESIINVCKLTPNQKKDINNQVDRWASQGLRILALSYKRLSNRNGAEINDTTLKESVFLGMVAIHDPLRSEVGRSIEKTNSAGIKVVMVTGDNEKTAQAIAEAAGLLDKGDKVITGSQLEALKDKELLKILPKIKIFARTNPFQKHRIVELYQRLGEIVAVTGDGVNDAIALKQADVGVAMGKVGTDVARETADMIITDDDFSTIVTAIEEGRGIINSIKNAIKYLLSCNITEAFSLIVGLTLGLPTLFYPIQLLYINLVTDGLPALMLSFSPKDPNLMKVLPQKDLEILKPNDKRYIISTGTIGMVLVIFSYFIYKDLGQTAAFSILTMIQPFVFIDLWLSHRHIVNNLNQLFKPLFIMAFIIPLIFQFIILSLNPLATIFKIKTVPWIICLEFMAISAVVLFGIRLVKNFIGIEQSS